ncbi:MAG: Ig-like domain-containing protein, partial [Deinococcota bacterium]
MKKQTKQPHSKRFTGDYAMQIQKVFWLLLLALLVTACGGDSGPGSPNTAPFLTRNFADISGPSGETRNFDLVTYFDDRDQDAATLSYEALSSDSSIVAATLISGSILELTFDGVGNATVTVTATDTDGLSATDSFVVTVEDGNNGGTNTPPTSSPINDVTLLTSAPNQSLDLTTSFNDVEDSAQGLTYSAQSSNPNVVVVSTSGGTLTLEAQAEGTATVTVTARDSDGATVSETFTVTVEDDGNTGNTGPSLVIPIEDQTIGPDDPFTLDLSTFFDDLEDGPEGLIYSSNSSDDNVVVATVDGFILTLDPRELGSAEITITATDSEGLTIEDTFMVTVSEQPAEDPFLVRLFETVTALVGDPDRTIDLTRYFDDNQDGPEGLTYTAMSSDTAVVNVSIEPDGTDLVLDFGIAGTATVTVTATDSDGNSVNATFTVIVTDLNGGGNTPPTADNLTVQTDEDTPVNITLTGFDLDGDALTFTVASQPANGTLTGTAPNLTYTPNTGFTGTDSFTYTVNDGEDTSNVATVTITVNPVVAPDPRFEFVAGGSDDQVLVRLVN